VKNWLVIVLVIIAVAIAVVTWQFWSDQVGMVVTAALGLLGFGGGAVVRKVKKRAKKKARDIPDTDPVAVIDDINKRISD